MSEMCHAACGAELGEKLAGTGMSWLSVPGAVGTGIAVRTMYRHFVRKVSSSSLAAAALHCRYTHWHRTSTDDGQQFVYNRVKRPNHSSYQHETALNPLAKTTLHTHRCSTARTANTAQKQRIQLCTIQPHSRFHASHKYYRHHTTHRLMNTTTDSSGTQHRPQAAHIPHTAISTGSTPHASHSLSGQSRFSAPWAARRRQQ